MREIKFRAWNETIKKYIPWEHLIDNSDPWPLACLAGSYVTFEQFTGLRDKNGKEIYEGDIVDSDRGDTMVRGAVAWKADAAFRLDTDADSWDLDCYVSLEIVGNIHENANLLNHANADVKE